MRFWTCRKCSTKNERKFTKCQGTVLAGGRNPKLIPCPGRKPKSSRPEHMAALSHSYEWYVEQFGERCGICGRAPAEGRRLYRDHDHRTGEPRGLLCFRDNRFGIPYWVDSEWALNLAKYLDRTSIELDSEAS